MDPEFVTIEVSKAARRAVRKASADAGLPMREVVSTGLEGLSQEDWDEICDQTAEDLGLDEEDSEDDEEEDEEPEDEDQ